jgi:hypothetical protein
MRQFGYIPTSSKLAVVLGRDSDDKEKMAILDKRRRYVPDVEIITFDKILETQAHQLSPIIAPTMIEVASLRFGRTVTTFLRYFPAASSFSFSVFRTLAMMRSAVSNADWISGASP